MVWWGVISLFVVVASLQNGKTPLFEAAYKGHIEVVHALVAAGASINGYHDVRSMAAQRSRADSVCSQIACPPSCLMLLPRCRLNVLRCALLRKMGTPKWCTR